MRLYEIIMALPASNATNMVACDVADIRVVVGALFWLPVRKLITFGHFAI